MVIVSQDKECFVMLSHLNLAFISDNTDENGKYGVVIMINDKSSIIMGRYRNRDCALNVLNGLLDTIIQSEVVEVLKFQFPEDLEE